MKFISIYIVCAFGILFGSIGVVQASSDKQESGELSTTHNQHPPHDHHHEDHVKKLDETALGRRRQKGIHGKQDSE